MSRLDDFFNFTSGFFKPIMVELDDASFTPPMASMMSRENSSYFIDDLWINGSEDIGDQNETAVHPHPMEMEAQIILVIIYSLITLLSVVGNVIVIIVFAIGRRSKSDIRIFLINLAIADLILAIFCMPFSFSSVMLDTWIFSAPLCPIVNFMQVFSVTASVLTNMAIGIDRYIVVTYPLKSMSTKYRLKIIIVMIWLMALLLAGVELWIARVSKQSETSTKLDCFEQWTSTTDKQAFTLFILTFTYLVPFIILTITYSIIARNLWTRTAPGNRDQVRDAAQLKSKRKVVKMLIIILALFGVCWLPLHVFFLVLDYSQPVVSTRVLSIIYFCVHVLAMSNSFQNPIIYGFMNNQFRADLCDICVRWFPCCTDLRCVKMGRNSAGSIRVPSRGSNNNQNSDNSDTVMTSIPEKQKMFVKYPTRRNNGTAVTKPLMNGHAHRTGHAL